MITSESVEIFWYDPFEINASKTDIGEKNLKAEKAFACTV